MNMDRFPDTGPELAERLTYWYSWNLWLTEHVCLGCGRLATVRVLFGADLWFCPACFRKRES